MLILKIPFLKYIEALIACKLPLEEIVKRITALGVPLSDSFSEEVIENMHRKLAATNVKYFSVPNSIPDLDWLRQYNIHKFVAYELKLEIAEGTKSIEGAFQLLNDPEMYRIISSLALAKVEEEDIDLIVNGKYNIHYSVEDIMDFLHYFFDVTNWTLNDKTQYIKHVASPSLVRDYKLAIQGDKHYLVWRLGIAPSKSFDSMLKEMMADAYYNFKEKLKIDADTAQKWGMLALRITDRTQRLDDENSKRRNLFDEIQFIMSGGKDDDDSETTVTINKKKIPHISELKEDDQPI